MPVSILSEILHSLTFFVIWKIWFSLKYGNVGWHMIFSRNVSAQPTELFKNDP